MIFYFSATGNCKYIAERISEETNDTIISITQCADNNQFSFSVDKDENIGIISPTYFLGLPSIVSEFIRKLNINNSNYTFFIATYGTTPGQSGRYAQKATKSIKFNAFYSIKMPDTWTPVFDLSDKNKINKILAAVEPQLNNTINLIKEKLNGDFMKNKIPTIFSNIIYKTYKIQSKTNKFTVDDTCIGCGLCEKKCPSHAIIIQNRKPMWIKNNCILCLGCLHRCPKFSIQYGKKTRKHGQYVNPNTKL